MRGHPACHDRVAELSYRIASEEVGHVRCDGLVAATPVGSTGYNLANQGPILAWGVEGYVVSYIAPHSLTARALVVAPRDVLHVLNAAGRDDVEVAIDGKRIADLASVYDLPITTHNTASQLHTMQLCQWAASIRNFLICETSTGEGGWMDQVLKLDGPYIEKGYIKVNDKPGTGTELNREVVTAHLLPGEKWWGDL